jgi:Ca-activated chloride channel family protein
VPAGAAAGTYASYAYTAQGSPAKITAPETPGPYEIRYQSDRVPGVFKSIPIVVQ